MLGDEYTWIGADCVVCVGVGGVGTVSLGAGVYGIGNGLGVLGMGPSLVFVCGLWSQRFFQNCVFIPGTFLY